jgi:hypothetical protein
MCGVFPYLGCGTRICFAGTMDVEVEGFIGGKEGRAFSSSIASHTLPALLRSVPITSGQEDIVRVEILQGSVHGPVKSDDTATKAIFVIPVIFRWLVRRLIYEGLCGIRKVRIDNNQVRSFESGCHSIRVVDTFAGHTRHCCPKADFDAQIYC